MYTWGDGSRSMLGHGEEIEEHRPRIVDALSTLSIKLVSCGTNHTLCVTGECHYFNCISTCRDVLTRNIEITFLLTLELTGYTGEVKQRQAVY